jgi:uncharacterized OB-fold protein
MTQPMQAQGAEGRLQYQRCGGCGHVWYFQRDFCPACGHAPPQTLAADGAGTLHASTLVHRAPSEEFKPLLPYSIVLVDLREGFASWGMPNPASPWTRPCAARCAPSPAACFPIS